MIHLLSKFDWKGFGLAFGIGYLAPPALVVIVSFIAAIAASNAETFGPTIAWLYVLAYLVSPILAGLVAAHFARSSPLGIAALAAVVGGLAQMRVFHMQTDISWLPFAWVAGGVGLALFAVFVSGRAKRELRHDV